MNTGTSSIGIFEPLIGSLFNQLITAREQIFKVVALAELGKISLSPDVIAEMTSFLERTEHYVSED
jgi:hypothetical protein